MIIRCRRAIHVPVGGSIVCALYTNIKYDSDNKNFVLLLAQLFFTYPDKIFTGLTNLAFFIFSYIFLKF